MTPFFIHENYPRSRPLRARNNELQTLMCLSNAADSVCTGDQVNSAIKMQNWALLPTQSHFSALMPSYYMRGGLSGMTQFPQVLGQTSKKNRFFIYSVFIMTNQQEKQVLYLQCIHNDKPARKTGSLFTVYS